VHETMKKHWAILCVALLILLSVAVLVAYRIGVARGENHLAAFVALDWGQHDADVLSALRTEDILRATKLVESHLMEMIVSIDGARDTLLVEFCSEDEIDSLLSSAARLFDGHRITGPLLTVDEHLEREGLSLTNETDRSIAEYQRRHFEVVQTIFREYLDKESPNTSLHGSTESRASASSSAP